MQDIAQMQGKYLDGLPVKCSLPGSKRERDCTTYTQFFRMKTLDTSLAEVGALPTEAAAFIKTIETAESKSSEYFLIPEDDRERNLNTLNKELLKLLAPYVESNIALEVKKLTSDFQGSAKQKHLLQQILEGLFHRADGIQGYNRQ